MANACSYECVRMSAARWRYGGPRRPEYEPFQGRKPRDVRGRRRIRRYGDFALASGDDAGKALLERERSTSRHHQYHPRRHVPAGSPHAADVMFEQAGREAVAQGVRRHALADLGLGGRMAGAIELARHHRIGGVLARKQPALWRRDAVSRERFSPLTHSGHRHLNGKRTRGTIGPADFNPCLRLAPKPSSASVGEGRQRLGPGFRVSSRWPPSH